MRSDETKCFGPTFALQRCVIRRRRAAHTASVPRRFGKERREAYREGRRPQQ